MTHTPLLQFICQATNNTWNFWFAFMWKTPLKFIWILIKILWNLSPVVLTVIYNYVITVLSYLKYILIILSNIDTIKYSLHVCLSWKKSVIYLYWLKKSIKIITILYVYNANAWWGFNTFWLKVVLACLVYPYFLIFLTFVKKLYNAMGFYGLSWDSAKCSQFFCRYIFSIKVMDNSGTFYVLPLPLPKIYLKSICLKRVNLPIKYIFYFRPLIVVYRQFNQKPVKYLRWFSITPIQCYSFYKACGTSWWALYYFKCCGFVYQGIAARIERINYYWPLGIADRYYTLLFVCYDIILTLHLISCILSFHFFMVLTHQDITHMSFFSHYIYFGVLPWFSMAIPTIPHIQLLAMFNTSWNNYYNLGDVLLPGIMLYYHIIWDWYCDFGIIICVLLVVLNYRRNWKKNGLFIPTVQLKCYILMCALLIACYGYFLCYIWCLYHMFYAKAVLMFCGVSQVVYF